MTPQLEPVQIVLQHDPLSLNRPIPAAPGLGRQERAERFWRPLRELMTEPYRNMTVGELEVRLLNSFDYYLREEFIKDSKRRLEELERLGREGERVTANGDAAAGQVESAPPEPEDTPERKEAGRRLALARDMKFKVTTIDYSSLVLGITFAEAFKAVADFFGKNPQALAVFFGAFAPKAFEATFDSAGLRDSLAASVNVPNSVRNAFAGVDDTGPGGGGADVATTDGSQFNRMWWIANGSLLVPALLAIALGIYVTVVMFGEISRLHTMQESLGTAQIGLYNPLVEHQMNLLKEDRERMALLLEKLFPKAEESGDPASASGTPPPRRGTRKRRRAGAGSSPGDVGGKLTRHETRGRAPRRVFAEYREDAGVKRRD